VKITCDRFYAEGPQHIFATLFLRRKPAHLLTRSSSLKVMADKDTVNDNVNVNDDITTTINSATGRRVFLCVRVRGDTTVLECLRAALRRVSGVHAVVLVEETAHPGHRFMKAAPLHDDVDSTPFFRGYVVLYVVDSVEHLRKIPAGANVCFIIAHQQVSVDLDSALTIARARAATFFIFDLVTNADVDFWGSVTATMPMMEDVVRRMLENLGAGACDTAAASGTLFPLPVAAVLTAVFAERARTPWLRWSDFVTLVGSSVETAVALCENGCVIALFTESACASASSSADAHSDFVALDPAWLYNLARCVRVPSYYVAASSLEDFADPWSMLTRYRIATRELLDILWSPAQLCDVGGVGVGTSTGVRTMVSADTLAQLRNAVAHFLESCGVFARRIAANTALGLPDMWLVPHLMWCDTAPMWDLAHQRVRVRGWFPQTATRGTVRRQFLLPAAPVKAQLPHAVFRAVLAFFATTPLRCDVDVDRSWINVTSLMDGETIVIVLRDEAPDIVRNSGDGSGSGSSSGSCSTPTQLVLDVLAWYGADTSTPTTFGVLEALLPVVRDACLAHCTTAGAAMQERVPIVINDARAVTDVYGSLPDEATRRLITEHGVVGSVDVNVLLRLARQRHLQRQHKADTDADTDTKTDADTDTCTDTDAADSSLSLQPMPLALTLTLLPLSCTVEPIDVYAGGDAAVDAMRSQLSAFATKHAMAEMLLAPFELPAPCDWRSVVEPPRVTSQDLMAFNVRVGSSAPAQLPFRSVINWNDIWAVPTTSSTSTSTSSSTLLRDVVTAFVQTGAAPEGFMPVSTGAHGSVWRGVWRTGCASYGDVAVAVKVPKGNVDSFIDQVTILQALRSSGKGVVSALGFCLRPTALVMELCSSSPYSSCAPTLSAWVKSSTYVAETPATLLAVARNLCSALRKVHEAGVVHGDVLPRNVLVGTGVTTLCGFGFARRLGTVDVDGLSVEAPVVVHTLPFGTHGYMAPEKELPQRIALDADEVIIDAVGDVKDKFRDVINGVKCTYTSDVASDIWSLGVVFLQLFRGGDNSASADVVVSAARVTLAALLRSCKPRMESGVTYGWDGGMVPERVRNAQLFAKCARKRELPTLVFALAEWCMRPAANERPSLTQIEAVLAMMAAVDGAGDGAGADCKLEDDDAAGNDSDVANELAAARRLYESVMAGADAADVHDSVAGVAEFPAPTSPSTAAFASAVWRRASAAACRSGGEDFGVYNGLNVDVVLAALFCGDDHGDAPSDADTVSAVRAMIDCDDDGWVTLYELRAALRTCTDIASVCAKARAPVFAVPALAPAEALYVDVADFDMEGVILAANVVKHVTSYVGVGDGDDGDDGEYTVQSENTHTRLMVIQAPDNFATQRTVLKGVHTLCATATDVFTGGIVHVSIDGMQFSAAPWMRLFTVLCGAVGLTTANGADTARNVFRAWCSRQSKRGRVLIVVDGGVEDVNDIIAMLCDCMYEPFNLTASADDDDDADDDVDADATGLCDTPLQTRMTPNRVFLLVSGVAAKPQSIVSLPLGVPRVVYSAPNDHMCEWLHRAPNGDGDMIGYDDDDGDDDDVVMVRALLLCRLPWKHRAVFLRLCACAAPFDHYLAFRLCRSLAGVNQDDVRAAITYLRRVGLVKAWSSDDAMLVVADFARRVVVAEAASTSDDADAGDAMAVEDEVEDDDDDDETGTITTTTRIVAIGKSVEDATVAFIEYLVEVLCAATQLCTESNDASKVEALALYDHYVVHLQHLFWLGRNAMAQTHAVRCALMRVFDAGFTLMEVLEARLDTWKMVELWSNMWLCAQSMPMHLRSNVRRLGIASLMLSRTMYLMDEGDDAITAAKLGVALVQRIAAPSLRIVSVSVSDGEGDVSVATRVPMTARMVHDGALLALAGSVLANPLSEDKRADATMSEPLKTQFERLLAHVHKRLAAMKRAFSDAALQELELTDAVFPHLSALWARNSELARMMGQSLPRTEAAPSAGNPATSAAQLELEPAPLTVGEIHARVPLEPVAVLEPPVIDGDADVDAMDGAMACLLSFASHDELPRIDRALLIYCAIVFLRMVYCGTRTRVYASTWYNLANALADRNLKYVALVAYRRSTLADKAVLYGHHPDIARTLSSEAAVWYDLGKNAEAMALYDATLQMRVEELGESHVDVARTRSYRAIVFHEQQKFVAALREFERCLDIRFRRLGVHPDVAATLNNIAIVQNKLVTLKTARAGADMDADTARLTIKRVIETYKRCLRIRRHTLGAFHNDVAHTLDNLAVATFKLETSDTFSMADKIERAVPYIEQCIKVQEAVGKFMDVAKSCFKRGVMLLAYKEDVAFESFLKCLELRLSVGGAAHADVRATLRDVTAVFHLQLARSESGLKRRSFWLDLQLKTLAGIRNAVTKPGAGVGVAVAVAVGGADASSSSSSSTPMPKPPTPRLGTPVYRYVPGDAEMVVAAAAAVAAATATTATAAAKSAAVALVDADVATNMVGIGDTLLTLISSSCSGELAPLVDAADRCAVYAFAVAQRQVHDEKKMDSRMVKDLSSALINTGHVALLRGDYDDAAANFSVALKYLQTLTATQLSETSLKRMYVRALLGCAEAVVRTDVTHAFRLAALAQSLIDTVQWPSLQARMAALANTVALYNDAAEMDKWLSDNEIASLARAPATATVRI
jgi:tetratricopeptide (TPR) repeat protein